MLPGCPGPSDPLLLTSPEGAPAACGTCMDLLVMGRPSGPGPWAAGLLLAPVVVVVLVVVLVVLVVLVVAVAAVVVTALPRERGPAGGWGAGAVAALPSCEP